MSDFFNIFCLLRLGKFAEGIHHSILFLLKRFIQARNEKRAEFLKDTNLCDKVIVADVLKPIDFLNKVLEGNDGKEVDVSINCLSIANTEMSSILPVKDGGIVYFFSMATSFTQAALGAEGVGKDVTMIIGNGYTKDHAQIALDALKYQN